MNYLSKAKSSFKTKLNLFLFNCVINKVDFTFDNFQKFSIDEVLVYKYTTVYWQQSKDCDELGLNILEIESQINLLKQKHINLINDLEIDYIKVTFPKLFPKEDFEDLIKGKECHYCHITEDEIDQLGVNNKLNKKNFRGWHMEIDRLNSNYEYSWDNCVMACYWCNNAKTDEFTEPEFKIIGESITKIWENRLKDIH